MQMFFILLLIAFTIELSFNIKTIEFEFVLNLPKKISPYQNVVT